MVGHSLWGREKEPGFARTLDVFAFLAFRELAHRQRRKTLSQYADAISSGGTFGTCHVAASSGRNRLLFKALAD
jgi:hypothetical protein